MYQFLWELLEEKNLTEYLTDIELAYCELRAFALVMLYGEFCEIESGEYYSYDFDLCEDISSLSPFVIGIMTGREKITIDELDLESNFVKLVKKEKNKVIEAMKNFASDENVSTIFVSMLLATYNFNEQLDDINEDEFNEMEHTLSENSYESYIENMQELSHEVLNFNITINKQEAFSWLSEGAYSLR